MKKDKNEKEITAITQLFQPQVTALPEHSNGVVDNNVYIFDYIEDDYRWQVLIPLHNLINKHKTKLLNKLKEAKKTKSNKIEVEEINVFIDSGGGEVTLCWATCALLSEAKECGIMVNTHIIGRASSAASMIAVMGNYRTMYESSYHGLHYGNECGVGIQNKHCIETHTKRMLDNFDSTLKHYKKYTKAPLKKLNSWLNEEITYLNSDECVRYGLVDEIIKI